MKKIVLMLCATIIAYSLNASGDERHYSYALSIDVFEQSFNFYYNSIEDTIHYTDEKGKDRYQNAAINITFYDIAKDSSFNLFSNNFNESIVTFFFEKEYSDTFRKIDFQHLSLNYSHRLIGNNENIDKREISQFVYIVTYSFQTETYSLWTCYKTGKNLKKLTEYKNWSDLKVDVYNNNMLVIRHLDDRTVKIEKISNQL